MTFCNFPALDEPLCIEQHQANVLAIETVEIYSKVVYSLYQRDLGLEPDYPFVIFDDNFKKITALTIVQNPLLFNFNTTTFKKLLFHQIIGKIDIDERLHIEKSYTDMVEYFQQEIFTALDIDFFVNETCKIEDVLKLMQVDILDSTSSIFEKCQLILNVLKEVKNEKLIIFCGLGELLSKEEYCLVIEAANLNQQQVLLIEHGAISNSEKTRYFFLDEDLILWEE